MASTYLLLSFYSQCRLIVNTNGSGEVREKALDAVKKILGPFALIGRPNLPQSLAHVFYSEREPFGTKCGPDKRIVTQVQLCVLFGELYRLGWRATPVAPVMDAQKRRGTIIFKYHPRLASSSPTHEFASLSMWDILSTVVPDWAEGKLFRAMNQGQREDGPRLEKRFSRKEWRTTSNKILVSQRVYIGHARAAASSTETGILQIKMGHMLGLMRSMRSQDFALEASFSVFGDQPDIVMFGHRIQQEGVGTEEGPPPESPSFGLTVTKPRNLVLADAAPDVHQLITKQVQEDNTWRGSRVAGDEWWSRKWGSLGKVAYGNLLKRLALAGYFPSASYDGLYKNSFILFTHDPSHLANPSPSTPHPSSREYHEQQPRVISFTAISDKKLKVDDIHTAALIQRGERLPADRDTRRCLEGLDGMLSGTRKCPTDETLRIFSGETFSSNNVELMAKELCIFLVATIQMDLMGYTLLASGNLSGRYDRPEREERMVSPHTWFFCHLGPLLARSARLQQPPSFEAVTEDATGLPTYEEAIKLGGGGGAEEVDGAATEDESDEDVERGSESP